MARFFKKREAIKGLSPGSLIFIGNQKVDNIRIRVIDYDRDRLKEGELKGWASKLKTWKKKSWKGPSRL